MIKAIMAVDDEWGFSKNGSMPWPKNTEDLQHFKATTNNNIIVMGRLTWDDPFMPTPLKNRINILVTSQSPDLYPGADRYISDDLIKNIKNINSEYENQDFLKNKDIFIIGGANLIFQVFDIIDIFFITHIKGAYNCDKKLDRNIIINKMKVFRSAPAIDDSCVFKVWMKNSVYEEKMKNF